MSNGEREGVNVLDTGRTTAVIHPGHVKRPALRGSFSSTRFASHSIARINDTFLCPIVFNVVEEMKVELERF